MLRSLLGIATLLLAPALATAPVPGSSVVVRVDAVLGADGLLRGTLTSTYSGACADELRARLKAMKPEERSRTLTALAGAALTGHIKLEGDATGLETSTGSVVARYAIDAPRFAPVTGRSMRLGLPLLQPYDPGKLPASLLPVTIVHDLAIKLPPSTRPLEFPSAFSTVTPDAGRYVLYFDMERGGDTLTARRELELTGSAPARLRELLDGVAAHDSTTLTIAPAAPRPSSG